jgi:DNA-directed RNA polymerase specialized sigma24 family protein
VYKPRPGVSIVHWLSRIARNVRIDACRKLQARREVQFPVDPDGNEIDLSPVVRNSLVIFPDSLQGTDRQLAELLLAGFTIAEASAKAGLSAAAGRKRFQRIREKYSSRAVTLTKS